MTSVTPISEQRARRSDFPFTDSWNSRRFVAENRDDVRFVPGIGWLTWDGKRWAPDVDGAIRRLAKQTIDPMYAEAVQDLADAGSIADTNERRSEVDLAKGRLNHALKSQAEAKLRAMVSLAETELEVIAKAADLDCPPLLFCTPSGTVDLTDGMLHPHRREDLITRVTSAAYDPDAIAPRWTRFLREIMAGDETRVAYLQRMIGYAVTGLTREQKTPAAGRRRQRQDRSRQDAGEVAGRLRRRGRLRDIPGSGPGQHSQRFGPPPWQAFRARVGNAARRAPGHAAPQGVGGGRRRRGARTLPERGASFQPITKLWFLANCVPVVQDSSFGIWRRLVRLPFEVTIPEEKARPGPGREAHGRRPRHHEVDCFNGAGPTWLRGSAKIRSRQPPQRHGARSRTRFGRWIGVAAVLVAGEKAARRTVRASYVGWCEAEGERAMGTKVFAEELRLRGVDDGGTVRLEGKPVPAWVGIRLLDFGDRRVVEAVEGQNQKYPHGDLLLGSFPKQPSTPLYVSTREPGEDEE